MSPKKTARLRRARRGRERMKRRAQLRLSLFRSGRHLYAQVLTAAGDRVLAAASTLEPEVRKLKRSRMDKARRVGELVAERTLKQDIDQLAFDRSGYKYHGSVKALADSAREAGLKF